MRVLLNKDVKSLGRRGDIVNVKNGYFMNFLFPGGFAEVATTKVVLLAEGRNQKRVMEKGQVVENAQEVLKKLKGLVVKLQSKVSDKGTLYGSITEDDVIAEVQKLAKVELQKDFIKMDHFKEVGEYKALVHLGEGLEEEITVQVEAA